MYSRFLCLLACIATSCFGAVAGSTPGLQTSDVGASALRVSNHHPFPIRESIHFHLAADLAKGDGSILAVSHSVTGGTVEAHYLPIQVRPSDENRPAEAWIDVQFRPSESRVYTFQKIGGGNSPKTPPSILSRFPSNLPRAITWPSGTTTELVDLLFLTISDNVGNQLQDALANPAQLNFDLKQEEHGPVRSTLHFRANSEFQGTYQIDLHYNLYTSGIVDIEIELRSTKALPKGIALGLAKKIPSGSTESAAIRSQGEITSLQSLNASNIHPEASWLAWENSPEEDKTQALLRHHFTAPELLARDDDGSWVMITQIDRSNSSVSRFTYRLLPPASRSFEAVDQAFMAFAGYQHREYNEEELHVSFGVSGVEFGIGFSGNVTLESGAIIAHADLQRNMRIANALGIDWIRVRDFRSPDPSLDFLQTPSGAEMLNHLDELTTIARETGLSVLLHFALSPADARLVAERFGDVIRFYEIATPANDGDRRSRIRTEIHSVQPEATVFSSKAALNEQGSAIGRHLAVDATQPTHAVRDVALSLANAANRLDSTPILTAFHPATSSHRQTEQTQAQQLFQAYDHLLSQRSIPIVFHVGFDREGLLRPDGTPRIPAHAYHEIIRRYSKPDNRIRNLQIQIPGLSLRPGQTSPISVTFTNSGSRPLKISTRLLLPEGLTSSDHEKQITLRARQTQVIERAITATDDLMPGFYHLFEEARFDDTIRLGWTHAAYRGAPALDTETQPRPGVSYPGGLESLVEINPANLRHTIFGDDASEAEIDSAIDLTYALRHVTGADIQFWPSGEIKADQLSRSHLLVGNQQTNPLIARILDRLPLDPMDLGEGEGVVMVIDHPTEFRRFLLIISGRDATGIARAATDLTNRYGTR